MSPDRITQRLTDAIATLDELANWLTDDLETSADLATVACDLAELKLEIECEQIRAVQRVPA